MAKCVDQCFSTVVSDDVIAASVLDKCPNPVNRTLSLKPFDRDVVELLPQVETKLKETGFRLSDHC